MVANLIIACGFPIFLYLGATMGPDLHKILVNPNLSLEVQSTEYDASTSQTMDWDSGPAAHQ